MIFNKHIIEAIEFTKAQGIELIRGNGAIFDWTAFDLDIYGKIINVNVKVPTRCDAIGAVLIMHEKAHLIGPGGFNPEWRKELYDILEESEMWVWKFMHGWGYAHELEFEVISKDKKSSRKIKDEVSQWANKLAKEHVDKRCLK